MKRCVCLHRSCLVIILAKIFKFFYELFEIFIGDIHFLSILERVIIIGFAVLIVELFFSRIIEDTLKVTDILIVRTLVLHDYLVVWSGEIVGRLVFQIRDEIITAAVLVLN